MEDRTVPLAELPAHVDELLRARGATQVNLYRALANSPAMVDAWLHFLWDLRDRCRAPRSLRELVILRAAVHSSSDYEWAHHLRMARAFGVSEDRITAVTDRGALAERLSDEERLALELTDAIVDGAVPDGLVQRAVGAWGPEEYVEMVLTISVYVMVPRVLDALRVPLEDAVAGTRLRDYGAGQAPA